MKRYFNLLLFFLVAVIVSATYYQSFAGCISQNGEPDNGFCDKSDINNKVCTSGETYDCFRLIGQPGQQ